MFFEHFWQVGVRWNSMILLIENDQEISANIVLRSIFEIQKKIEFILSDKSSIRKKLLAYRLNMCIEHLKAQQFNLSPDVIKETRLTDLIDELGLEEISELVFSKYKDEQWRKFNWLVLFDEERSFSKLIEKLDGDFSDFSRTYFSFGSIETHGNTIRMSSVLTKDSPFKETISKVSLFNILAILLDFENIVELFLEQYYPIGLCSMLKEGRIFTTVGEIFKLMHDESYTFQDSFDTLESEKRNLKFEKN